LAEELINEFGEQLDSITLVRGSGGRFEVTVDGNLVFSKAELKRHAQQGEIVEKIQERAASGRDIRGMTH
jgi:selenoprotein W-related protein